MTLFDPTPYGPGTPPKRPRAQTPPQTFAVRADSDWRIVLRNQPGIVHAAKAMVSGFGGFETHCGRVGGPRSFNPGQLVVGCQRCLDHGAPRGSR